MAAFSQLKSGNWRVQVRRKGRYLNETFRRRQDGERWALDVERRIDLGETPTHRAHVDPATFGHLIDLHVDDMREVGQSPRRSKSFTLDQLRKSLGSVLVRDLGRERLIQFGRDRAKAGAGPVTLGADIGYIRTILAHAAAVHGIALSLESVDLARIALKRLGLVGKSRSRDRRPTPEEIERIVAFAEDNPRQSIPMGRIVHFAIATALRVDEICRIQRDDINEVTRIVIVRDRKDPRNKQGNDQKVPLLSVGGLDAWQLLQEQRLFRKRSARLFPYNSRSVSTAFRRICNNLGITDLHFHDLRHEATSRLFEAGFTIEQVALVTGHKDWKMLKRYANLRPESLHRIQRGRTWASYPNFPPHHPSFDGPEVLPRPSDGAAVADTQLVARRT